MNNSNHLSLLLILLIFSVFSYGQNCTEGTAAYATQGTSEYKDQVLWLTWGGDAGSYGLPGQDLRNGASSRATFYLANQQMCFECSIETTSLKLKSYKPGNWRGDSLDDMYNIGGTGSLNTLINGISISEGIGNFKLVCKSKLNGVPYKIKGLVMGDAESMDNTGKEFLKASGKGIWQVVEMNKTLSSNTGAYEVSKYINDLGTNEIAITRGNDDGAAAVSFLSFNESAYDGVDQSVSIDFSISGNGTSGIAIGLLVPNADGGDAPTSYGEVYHLIKDINISSDGILNDGVIVNTNSTSFIPGKIIPPLDLFLGSKGPDAERRMLFSDTANGDDTSGSNANEEDAWPNDKKYIYNILPGREVVISVPYVSYGQTYLSGWIDFNHNGVFDANEKASVSVNGTGAGNATLVWIAPDDFVKGKTFARLRLSSSRSDVELPTGIAVDGEVEDHEIFIDDPKFSILKTSNAIDNTWKTTTTNKSYFIQIKNMATVPSYGTVKVLDVLPLGITPNWSETYVSNGWQLTYSGQLITAISTLSIPSNGISQIEIPVLFNENLPSNSYINYASVGGGGDNDYPQPIKPLDCITTDVESHCTSYEVTIIKEIEANDDSYGSVTSTNTNALGNVIINDTFGGQTPNILFITINQTGANANVTIDESGNVRVVPGTPSGTYTTTYEICEIGSNIPNCANATVTVVVENPIVANDDVNNVTPYTIDTFNVTDNDTLNGNTINLQTPENLSGSVILTNIPVDNSPVTVNPNGSIRVVTGTPSGTYTYSYEICEIGADPKNCDTAVGTIVYSNTIEANPDNYGIVNVDTQIGNILNNDLFNNQNIQPGDVVINYTSEFITIDEDGNVKVLPNIPAGTYQIPYIICENITSPNSIPNCSTTTISFTIISSPVTTGITVATTPEVAVTGNVEITPGSGAITSITTPNLPNDVAISFTNDGQFTVTPGAIYQGGDVITIDYFVEDENGLTTQSTIIVKITEVPKIELVKTADIQGNQIIYNFTITNTGNVTINNVTLVDTMLSQDILLVNPSTLLPGQSTSLQVPYTLTLADLNNGSVTNTATVNGVTINNTPVSDVSGTSGTNDEFTVINLTQNPVINLIKTSRFNDENNNGFAEVGETITYTFVAANTGNVTLNNVSLTDDLLQITNLDFTPNILNPGETTQVELLYSLTQNDVDLGLVVNTAEVTSTTNNGDLVFDVSGTDNANDNPTETTFDQNASIAIVKKSIFKDENGDGVAQVGESITYAFTIKNTGDVTLTNVTVSDTLNGIVLNGNPIAELNPNEENSTAFTATYYLTLEDLIAGQVINQATVQGTTKTGELVLDQSDDLSFNGNNPTVNQFNSCKINIFNAVSPDDDGMNDFFYIQGIECYPNNSVEIYNRWGVLVYETNEYNNSDKSFKGYSEGRVTIKNGEPLPVGTYFYIFKFIDFYNKQQKVQGYLYLNR